MQNTMPPISPTPAPVPTAPKYLWDTDTNRRASVKAIQLEEGLDAQQCDDMFRTLSCEANFEPWLVHPNYVVDKATGLAKRDAAGARIVSTTDYGLCAINDWWHIAGSGGPGKDFPSPAYVLANPEADIRWMCRMWKAGQGRAWVCYSKGLYKHYN